MAATEVSNIQWYPRDTGELILVFSSPVFVKGEHFGIVILAVLPKPKKNLPLFRILVAASGFLPLAIQFIFDKHISVVPLFFWLVMAASAEWIYSEWFLRPIKELGELASNLVSADLTQLGKAKNNDELGQLIYKWQNGRRSR